MPHESAEAMIRYEHYIDGAAVAPSSGEYLPTENPYTGKVWAEIARGNRADAEAAVAAAQRAFSAGAWPALTPSERGRMLWRLGDLVVANAPRLAEIEQRDNGKLAAEVVTQVRYMGDYFRYYAGLADKVQSAGHPDRQEGRVRLHALRAEGRRRDHHAVELAADADQLEARAGARRRLHGGDQAVGVHVGVDARARRSCSPRRASRTASSTSSPASAPRSARRWSRIPTVAHIGFTGGSAAGRKIYELAARNFKTVTLELGGKSPNIVFDDADLDQAVKGVVSGIFAATGQSCQAGSRLLVQRSIHDVFVAKLIDFMKDVKLGDPTEADTQIGPVATRPQFEKVLSYIEIAKAEGATCALGGRSRPDLGAGLFVEPTIFTGVKQQHAHRAGGSVRPGARGDPVRGRGRRDRASATTSPTASPPRCGRATCAAP